MVELATYASAMALGGIGVGTGGRVRALLGPTNTGKTYRAIQRMLGHRSGMIGLPLRLLAREVYDRVVAVQGVNEVALVTGEEKWIPPRPRYFVCTVEAMPVDRRVEFLAVDEIQLAGHRTRGHVFTDRILHARGMRETLFLGSRTIEPLLRQLLPEIEVNVAPRLSKLSWGGMSRLQAVPQRSAVVAFSAREVYETAEHLRVAHGGVAVVLEALSWRARNAQLAMYQAGDVKHIVATDAIGMGLNMDLHHVAFTAVRKYDGRRHRDLSVSEVAQIAGRAGRYRTDGTFGTTRALGPLGSDVVSAIERHEFPALKKLYYRNSHLDFQSPANLLESLDTPPPHPLLAPAGGEEDRRVLEELVRRDELVGLVTRPERLALLWEVARCPDYRQANTGLHVDLLAQIGTFLLGDPGHLPDDWVAERVARLDRVEGDIETLMGRIASTRTWTYLSHQNGWTMDPAHWQERIRAIEERLSDALHDQLTQRFVDRSALAIMGGSGQPEVSIERDGSVRVGDIVLGSLDGLTFVGFPGRPPTGLWKGIRRALAPQVRKHTEAINTAPDQAFEIVGDGQLICDLGSASDALAGDLLSPSTPAGLGISGMRVVLGRIKGAEELLCPRVHLGQLELLGVGQRSQVRERVDTWLKESISAMFAPLRRGGKAPSAAARGLLVELERHLGAVPEPKVRDLLGALEEGDRQALARRDVRLGIHSVYVQSLLKPKWIGLRAMIWSAHAGQRPWPVPPDGRTALPVEARTPSGFYAAVGYRVCGRMAVRLDVVERMAAWLRCSISSSCESLDAPMSWLAVGPEGLSDVVSALGYQLCTLPDGRVQITQPRRRGRSRRGRQRRSP